MFASLAPRLARRSNVRFLCNSFDASRELLATPKTAEGAQDLYDRWASTYDESLQSWGYEAPQVAAKILSCVADKLELSKHSLAYDAGCGTGQCGEKLRNEGFTNLTGSDISNASLEYIKEHKRGVYQELVVSDLEKPLPFASDRFTFVSCVGVMSYVSNFGMLFEEWIRVTKPGGLIVFTHNTKYWEEDLDGVQSKVTQLEEKGKLMRLAVTEPMEYMPNNPVESEREKKIRYFVFGIAGLDEAVDKEVLEEIKSLNEAMSLRPAGV